MTPEFPHTRRVIDDAIAARVFPGAIVEIGRTAGPIATWTRGHLAYDSGTPAVDAGTIYDLASLTKVLATTALVLQAVEIERMRFDDPVRFWLPGWRGDDRAGVTIQDLLEHASGLPAHRHYYETMRGTSAYLEAICIEPLEAPPRTSAVYSDLGFMLLGFALEAVFDAPLDGLFNAWRDGALGPEVELVFRPPSGWRARTAPTEVDAAGMTTCGVVHDENAAALAGVAGHAGLFGTAEAVGCAARWWLRRLQPPAPGEGDAAWRIVRPSAVPGSSRAMGWDTMRPTSSCGTHLSPRAIGHTGFTGTSLWIDPATDLYVVFLSNRVHPRREGDAMRRVRPALHDAVMIDLLV